MKELKRSNEEYKKRMREQKNEQSRKINAALLPEEKKRIKELQNRKKRIKMYGDDYNTRCEVGEVQEVINRIKMNALRRAEAVTPWQKKRHSKVDTSVPLNINIDKICRT